MGNCCMKEEPIESDILDGEESHISGLEKPSERVKFLLLGTGESGKSTLFKQMKINYAQDFTQNSLAAELRTIVMSVFQAFADFKEAIKLVFGNVSEDPDLVKAENSFFPVMNPGETPSLPDMFTPELTQFMKTIWTSEWGVEIWDNYQRYSVVECLEYFMENIDRVSSPTYEPTEMDYLKSRVMTNGVHEQTFDYKGVTLLVVDVGGQRSERRKWIQCFDGVTAVLFVASLSEFDHHVLFEETTANRLEEAIELFGRTIGFFIFKKTPFVLFLNKQDLLQEKLLKMEAKGQNLDEYFPTLHMGTNYDNAFYKIQDYLRKQFLNVVPKEKIHQIYPQIVTATDKQVFRHVFNAATSIVLQSALKESFVEEL